jgi:hypothetical protein
LKAIVPIEVIEQKIILIGGQKVMLDSDLAALYGVTTKRLNEQVRRNLRRFPQDFMYQLSSEEFESLRSHFATLKKVADSTGNISPMLLQNRALPCFRAC